MKRTLAVVVSALVLVVISAAQQCPPGYPITVTSFNISPSTITGDGHADASATITFAPTENFNVPVCITGAIPSYACVPPSVPQVGSFICGCTAPSGMNTVYMKFWGNASVDTTDTMNAAVVYPTNPPGCNDPGQSASLTLQAPSTSDPQPTDGPCPTGDCAFAGTPINLTNGDTWIQQTDYAIPGLSGGITLTRTWNSLWPNFNPIEMVGTFGHSWRSTFNERLQSVPGGITYWLANGSQWNFTYDSLNNVYHLTNPLNEHGSLSCALTCAITLVDGTQKIFNSAGYLTTIKDRNNNQLTITYDASNRITQVTSAGLQSITFSYSDANNPNQATSVQDSTGTIATYTYQSGLLTQVAYPDGSQYNFAYDGSSQILNVTDSQGKVVETHQYDSQRRGTYSARATVNGQPVERVTLSYPAGQRVVFLTNSYGNQSNYYWASIGGRRIITSVNGQGCATCGLKTVESRSYNYNPDGSIASSTEGSNAPMMYVYDANDNVVQRSINISGNNLVWNYSYNNFGEVLTSTDPNGNITTNTYDANGNLKTVTTPKPDANTAASVTTFGYDTKGELTSITDPLSNPATTISYFSTGLIQWIKDGQGNKTSYTYDARGNRLTVTDAKNNVTKFAYDSMNRLTTITYPNAPHAGCTPPKISNAPGYQYFPLPQAAPEIHGFGGPW